MAHDWLTRESERWAAEGLITPEQRRAILDRYPQGDTLFGGATLAWLAWLVAGFGLILLVAWNWEGLSHAAKIGGTAALTLCAYGAAAWSARANRAGRAELLAFAGTLLAGAFIAAITDMWHVGDTQTWPLLAWAVVIALTAAVMKSPTTVALGASVLLFWVLTDTGRAPASWAFLVVFVVLAVALERRTHWLAAGSLSVAFGGFVTLTAMELWRTPSAAPAAFLLAVGAALDGWSHRATGRPAFARTTPALAFTIAGFAFLTIESLTRSTLGLWMSDVATMGPAIVLLVALIAVAVWTPGVTRARVTGLVALAWTAMWATTGAMTEMPVPLAWVWLIVASAGLVGVAISAIRESATIQSRAVLLAGIASIITLVLVHVTSGPNRFGRSALVLLASAVALWWSVRTDKIHHGEHEVP
ncbi:MAG: DUF2157 domain-containing protein [Acidimicrobiia bacterium]|nr:DUF2157 domain-containing protein [Acidimicrobiia bacterium]